MNMNKLVLAVALVLFAAVLTQAQIGPEVGMVGKSLFGYNGVATLDVVSPSEVSFNPACIPGALDLSGAKNYAEVDYGGLNFRQGPMVTNGWQTYATKLKGNWGLRLARYTIGSNRKQTLFTGPGVNTRFTGESYEIAIGKEVTKNLAVGVAWLPYENVQTSSRDENGGELIRANAKSDCQWRVGGAYQLGKLLTVGSVYSHDRSTSRVTSPTLSGESNFTQVTGQYNQDMVTTGAAIQPIEGTILAACWQKGALTGPGIDADIDIFAYNLRQYLNKDFSLTVGLTDRTWGYGALYTYGSISLGIAYSPDTYRAADSYLGRCRSLYLWLGKSW
jgi:hypothetical protein